MAKQPTDRYPSAREMAVALAAAAAGDVVAAQPEPNWEPDATRDIPTPVPMPAPTPAPTEAPTTDMETPPPMPRRTRQRRGWLLPVGIGVIVVGLVLGVIAAVGAFGGEDAGPAVAVAPVTEVVELVATDAPTQTAEPTSTNQPTPTATTAPTATATLSPGDRARALAEAGVSNNDDWTPYIEVINGVEMALVPAGCFMMGSEDDDSDESPVHEVCFEEPFWIDLTEVTNGQYGSVGTFSGADRPREFITWTASLAHCEARGARLPTEAEWEYAARGPDALVYPWGNTFVGDNVVYSSNSGGQTADVGSRPGGASWVGALDLSGNVWEWVNDWYDDDYYATLVDGVVNPQGPGTGSSRVLRGGSWGGNNSSDCRGANRGRSVPSDSYGYLSGFRCAFSYSP